MKSPSGSISKLPTGTVTFLFTDIQGSTPLWEQMPLEMEKSVAQHHVLLRQAIESNGGIVNQIIGDAFQAAFSTPMPGLNAAMTAQRLLQTAQWGATGPLMVRMGLHTGPAELDPLGNAPYAVSHTLNRAARIMSAGYGGQILLSQETADLCVRNLPPDIHLKDLGEHRLKGMVQFEHIFQAGISDLPSDFPSLATRVEHPHNLPARLTSFIGRESEIEALCDSLLRTDIRLLTITGVGGTGKTSLAQQAGWKLLDHFKDGVYFVDLTLIQNPDQVITAIAQGLSIHELPGRPLRDVLQEHLIHRKLLLIVDNFEHVITAGGFLVGLLQSAPLVKILVTSREPLHVSPERQFILAPLHLPDPHNSLASLQENEAICLFVERAQAIQSAFHLTPENGVDIAELCRQLDGMPLAIELIVARLRLFTPHQLLQQVEGRLRLLSGGLRDLPARHQTMRSAIAWSYDLLPEEEQRLFYCLAVFPGSFSLEAASAVCGDEGVDIILAMESLLDKNLVNRREDPAGLRFWLFETLREYALDRLEASGEREKIQRKHAGYYAQLLSTHRGQDYPLWDLERHNLRSGFNWAIETQEADLVYTYGAYFFAWEKQIVEGRRFVARALSLPNTQAHTSGRHDLLYSASVLALFSRDLPAAREYIHELGILGQEINYNIYQPQTLNSFLAALSGDYEGAVDLIIESGLGVEDDFGVAVVNMMLASYMLQLHSFPSAKKYATDGLDQFNKLWQPNPYGVDCLTIQGYIALEEKVPGLALEPFNQAFQLALECSVEERLGSIYMGLGEAARLTGDFVAAVIWMSLAETIKKATGFSSRIMLDSIQERYMNALKSCLTSADFNSTWEIGQALTLDQAIEYGKERLFERI